MQAKKRGLLFSSQFRANEWDLLEIISLKERDRFRKIAVFSVGVGFYFTVSEN